MNTQAQKILKKTLQMPPAERAGIAEKLISSLDPEIDQEVEKVWQIEVQSRLKEIDNNEVACISWEEVKERVKKIDA